MPIEIHELVIRATVSEARDQHELAQQLARLKAELLAACLGELEERLARAAER